MHFKVNKPIMAFIWVKNQHSIILYTHTAKLKATHRSTAGDLAKCRPINPCSTNLAVMGIVIFTSRLEQPVKCNIRQLKSNFQRIVQHHSQKLCFWKKKASWYKNNYLIAKRDHGIRSCVSIENNITGKDNSIYSASISKCARVSTLSISNW